MKILFSPSEAKTFLAHESAINQHSFIFPPLYAKRLEVLDIYRQYTYHASEATLQKLFGLKQGMEHDFLVHHLKNHNDFKDLPTCKAIVRYDGVAYRYLDYASLNEDAQNWLDNNVMIFSNLFGPILAKDLIPFYKLHQGEALGAFKPELFYKNHFSLALDEWLNEETVIDLRAGFYEKFYTLTQPYITMKFLKNGKVLSHFAKAYRGRVLRQIAQESPNTEHDFARIAFDGLDIMEIKISGLKYEYIYKILD